MTADRSTATTIRAVSYARAAAVPVCREITRCDWWNLVLIQADSSQPQRHLLAGDREQPVVAPVAVDVQEPRREAELLDAELLHDPQRRGVLRPDRHLDPVQADRPEAVVDRHRDGAR